MSNRFSMQQVNNRIGLHEGIFENDVGLIFTGKNAIKALK